MKTNEEQRMPGKAVLVRNETLNEIRTCSGTVVRAGPGNELIVLTVAHIFRGSELNLSVKIGMDELRPARILYLDRAEDISLIAVSCKVRPQTTYPCLSARSDIIHKGMQLHGTGAMSDGHDMSFLLSVVATRYSFPDGSSLLLAHLPKGGKPKNGMSGIGVFFQGMLIGVIVASCQTNTGEHLIGIRLIPPRIIEEITLLCTRNII